MTLNKINPKYYINVGEIMKLKKPRKKQKQITKILIDRDECLPLITW